MALDAPQTAPAAGGTSAGRPRVESGARGRAAIRGALPSLALWALLGAVLSVLTTRVHDWFAMPNELLYMRRAIAVAETLSPIPRLHGELVGTFDQLYPVLIAPAFRGGLVPDDLQQAHFLNAWIMSSACIPVFVLARRVTGRAWVAWTAGALAVAMPWIFLASLLLTEVAAYPAFLWAMLAMHHTAVRPSRRADVLALLAIGVAFLGRTQLASLALLLPVVLAAYEVGRARSLREGLRATVGRHRLLAVVYGAGIAAGVVLVATGRLAGTLGVYGATVGGTGSSIATDFGLRLLLESLAEHAATFALGLAILPFLVGSAWLLANAIRPPARPELHAFACLGAVILVGTIVQVTVFDLRFGEKYVHDRYLVYLVPLVVLACLCALVDARRPRLSLVAPTAVVVTGFAVGTLVSFGSQFPTVNADAPITMLYGPLADIAGGLGGARWMLGAATIVLAVLFVQAAAILRPRHLTVAMTVLLLVSVPGLTVWMFARFYGEPGWSSRPLTTRVGPDRYWVDANLPPGSTVAMFPYPISSSYLVSHIAWRDLEFWNKTVVRDVQEADKSFIYTSDTFPKRFLSFDEQTGKASFTAADFAVTSLMESRFRLAGVIRALGPGASLIETEQPWRAEWRTDGLYPDGWTRPGETATVRVYPSPEQRGGVLRTLTLAFRSPPEVPERVVFARSGLESWRGTARAGSERATLGVCVPEDGFAEVEVRVPSSSAIPGDLRELGLAEIPREGGVLVSEIALADEIGPPCDPGGA